MKEKIIILCLLIIPLSSISQITDAKEVIYGYWVQTELGYWKNDSEYRPYRLGMFIGAYDGLYFSQDSVEFLNRLDKFFLFYSVKDYEITKNTDFIWNNRICKYSFKENHLIFYRDFFNDSIALDISKFVQDTLVLKKDNYSVTFVKKKYDLSFKNEIKRIRIVDDGIGEFIRPEYEMEISSSGKIRLKTKQSRFYPSGLYEASLSQEKFAKILRIFYLIDLNEINNKEYNVDREATPREILIELKNQKLVKVLYDGHGGPIELYWFFQLLSDLYYSVDFIKVG